MPRPHEVVGGRLAGSIGRIRGIAAGRVETAVLRERAEHLVGRDVHEAESRLAAAVQPRPVAQRCLQQDEGAADVGVKERSRIVDRAVDMAFRCEMEDGIRVEIAKGAVHGAFGVCDVGVHELVARRTHHLGDGFAPTGIGQFIDCEDLLVAGAHSPAHRCRADEPGASGHDQPRHQSDELAVMDPADPDGELVAHIGIQWANLDGYR